MGEKVRLHRCHHCATVECQFCGVHRIVEGGCPIFTMLDPMLRKPRYMNPDGTYKRRINKVTTVKFDPENIDFVRDVIVPSDPKKFLGHFNRGVIACVNHFFQKYPGEFPVIPADRLSEFCRIDKKIAFTPESWGLMNDLIEYWAGTEHKVSRSHLVNYCIQQTMADVIAQANGGAE